MEDHLQTKWFFNNGINYEVSTRIYSNCYLAYSRQLINKYGINNYIVLPVTWIYTSGMIFLQFATKDCTYPDIF